MVAVYIHADLHSQSLSSGMLTCLRDVCFFDLGFRCCLRSSTQRPAESITAQAAWPHGRKTASTANFTQPQTLSRQKSKSYCSEAGRKRTVRRWWGNHGNPTSTSEDETKKLRRQTVVKNLARLLQQLITRQRTTSALLQQRHICEKSITPVRI